MNLEVALLYLAPAALALIVGLTNGRRASRRGLLIAGGCVLLFALVSYALHWSVERSTARSLSELPGTLGMLSIPALLGFVGPATFNDWRAAVSASAVLVSLFLFTGMPTLYAACVLFWACV